MTCSRIAAGGAWEATTPVAAMSRTGRTVTPEVRCNQSRSNPRVADPSFSTVPPPVPPDPEPEPDLELELVVARSAALMCRYRTARDPFKPPGHPVATLCPVAAAA